MEELNLNEIKKVSGGGCYCKCTNDISMIIVGQVRDYGVCGGECAKMATYRMQECI